MDGTSLETIDELSSTSSPGVETRNLNGRGETRRRKVKATLVFLSHLFLVRLEKWLAKTGLFFFRRRLPVIFVTLVILAALCLGLLRSNYKKIPPGLYENDESRGRQLLSEARKAFGTLDSWKVTIYFSSSNSSSNILSSGCLEYAGIIHDRVTNTSWFKTHCIIDSNGFCETNSPLTLKGLKRRDIQILTSNAQNATTIHVNEALRLYNVSVTKQISAQAISTSYFMRKPRNDEERNEFKKFWSDQKTSVLRRTGSGIHCESVHVLNTTIYDDNVWTILLFERLPLLYALPVFFSLGFVAMALQCHGLVSLCVIPLLITCVSVSFISAFGICNMWGMPFQEIYAVVPCFVVSKAFTDALLLLRSFTNAYKLPSPARRVSSCMTTAGLVITVTSLVTFILFALPIWSSFDGVTNFFAFALTSTILAYLTVLALFLNVLFGLSKTRKRKTSQPPSSIGNITILFRGNRSLIKYLVRFLVSFPGKVILTFIGLGLIVFCIFILATHGINLRPVESMQKRKMDKVTYDFTSSSVEDVSLVFTKGLNYSNRTSRSNIIAYIHKFKIACDKKCIVALNWVDSFEKWKIAFGQTCPVGRFHVCIGDFLSNNVTSIFQSDIKLRQQDNTIQTSRVRIPVTFSSNILKDSSMLEMLQENLRGSMFRDNADLVSSVMLVLEDFQTFLAETLYVLIFLTVILTLSLFPLTSSLRTPLLLVLTFLMLIMEVLTIMCLLDIPLNQLSYTCVYLVLVFSFIASVYVSESYIISKKEAIQDRVIDAIEVNLLPVFSGFGLAILTSVALGFSFPFLSNLFFQIIPALIIIGTIHAFIFLPCVLSTYGYSTNQIGHSVFPMSSFVERGLKRKRTVCCVTHENKIIGTPKFPSVSIIGISCRFPQASNKDEFWDMLKDGRCCVSSFPENRPEEFKKFKDSYHPMRFVPGRLCTLGGAYLDNIRKFDAEFFGISPQEANQMDPQQKILLHVAYEAIEDSGMKLEDLQACRTGVFVGLMNRDFADLVTNNSHLRNMDQFSSTGISASIVSNRISFCFNFNGPSFTVDTACSSSLTAFKLAIDSLRNEDCEVALVCAPNIILSYAAHMATSIAGLLAPDGRCKSFDSSGDGYGRGEGFAAVVLKLYDQAFKDEDDVYCEVLACGLNSDGANSTPITAPSSRSQADLFQAVLKKSGLHANDLDYIEAHGTGTAIGDVVETTSIAEVYGNTKRPLRIGSVKSNLNHTESTSGLAGLVKLSLMIKYGYFVPTINIQELNPKLKMTEKGLVVQETFEPWKSRGGKARIGAVNSYGFGGSNAHAILREATRPNVCNKLELTSSYCKGTNIITLSARSLNALKDSAQLHSQWLLENAKLANELRDVCFSLNERRTVHPHRLALAFNSVEEAVSALNGYNERRIGWEKMVSIGNGMNKSQKPVFMFGGQGAQWYAMGRQLIEKETVVAHTISEIDKVLKELGEGWKLKEEILASKENSKIDQLVFGQIATFSIQLAVARLLISWGVYPAAVVGHSLGEFTAACIAGALTLKETLMVVLLRAKQQLKCPENGAMAAFGMSAEEALSLIEELKFGALVEIAAYNDARSVTLSGDKLAIENIGEYLTANNVQVFWRILNTSRAFHSCHMAPIETSFKKAVQSERLKPKEVTIPFYSTVEGDIISGKKLDCTYWWKNIRNPVKFHQAIKCVLSDGYTELIEISAQPTLTHYIKQIAAQEDIADESRPVVISTLPRKTVEEQHKVFIQNTICKLYSLGYPIQWPRVRGKGSCSFVRPPTYPWQEKEYWYKSYLPHKETVGDSSERRTQYVMNHPFVGEINKAEQLTGQSCWTLEIDLHRFAFLKDHALIKGGSIMPGAAYIEMALAMAKDRLLCSAIELRGVRLWSLLTLPESQVRILKLCFFQGTKLDEATFKITCAQENQRELLLSSGEICCDVMKGKRNSAIGLRTTDSLKSFGPIIQTLQEKMEEVPLEEFKEITSRYGFSYGPCFSFINQVWKGKSEGLCVVNVDDSLIDEHELGMYVVHPSILDACLQSCFVTISEISETSIVPVGFERIQLTAVPVERNMVCHVTTNVGIFGSFDVTLMNWRGDVVLKMIKFQVAELTASTLHASPLLEDIIYETQWKELPKNYLSQPPTFKGMICVVLKDSRGLCSSFITSLKNQGVEVIEIEFPESRNFLANEEKDVKEALAFAVERFLSGAKHLKVVSFWPSEADVLPEHVGSIDRAQNLGFRSSVFLIKEMLSSISDMKSKVQIVFITQGTCILDEMTKQPGRPMPWSSTVWGLRRTAALENVNMKIDTVDLSLKPSAEEINLLLQHLGSETTEEELAFRGKEVYANRVTRVSGDTASGKSISNMQSITEAKRFFLEQNSSTREIFLREETQRVMNDDEVMVQPLHLFSIESRISSIVNASSDVLGFSGTVFQSGSKFKAGDEVFGLIKPCRVGNYLTIKETNLIPKPKDFTLKESAYIPMCLGIAVEVVQRVTSNCDSMKILIHEADSILGLAAAIISRTKGHLVLCTAHRELQETKEILLGHKLDVISDSSCIELGEKYHDFFDAVIYLSVPEPGSLQHSFRSLKPNGKLFLACNDLKAAIILPEQKSIKYERIRFADMMDGSTTFINLWFKYYNIDMLKVITKALQSLPQLDVHLFEAIQKWNNGCDEPVENVAARSYVFDDTEEQKAIFAGIDHFGLKENRSYIVAGGVRGFGFEVARWMCENGANTVILLARSEPSQDKLQEAAALQKKTKTKVIILQIDISREDDILSLEHKLQYLPSVAGIVLTAMVLRDNLISLMDIDSYRDVMAPKVTGGFLLHKLSLKMDLDFFILFSSVSSMVGNIGQASYSAANAFLDALASYRRHVLGLPGLSINWGPIGGAGILTREDNVANLLATVGFGLIPAVKGPEYMAQISCYQPARTQIGIFMVDWSVFCKSNIHLSETNRLEFLRNEDIPAGAQDDSASSLASRILLEKNTSKRDKMIEEFVISTFCSWLDVESLSEVDFNTSLYNYGVDSTGALTLKMQLESSLQISFEVFYFMQPDTTPSKIVQDVIQRMDSANTPNEESQTRTTKQESTEIHEEPSGINIANGEQQSTKTPCQAVLLYKPEKAEIKFFCIHPSHRFAMSLASIAIGFQSQDLVSFYAIGCTDPVKRGGDWSSVRELAIAYLELIQEKQRHGPYFIGGYSYGGLVAYEIACLLIEHEEQVEFLCMIDTFPWLPPSCGGYSRLASWFRTNFPVQNQVELQFKVYLEKLALHNLKMTKQEYDEMVLQQSTQDVMQALQTRSRQMNIPIYDLADLWESVLNDHVIANKTHEDWEPASTQYKGHVTYIKCEDRKYSPNLPLMASPHKAWNEVLPGPMDVLVCRGDHFSLSELPLARITGGIVVTAVGIKYRSLFPELYHFDTTYKQRKAIEQLKEGIPALVYTRKGCKPPKTVKLFLNEEKHMLLLSQGEQGTSRNLNGKTIKLQELRCILPGRYVRNAIKVVAKINNLNAMKHTQRNLYNVVSLFGKKRIFNVEFPSSDTLKEFYQVIEAIYNVKMELF